MKLPDLYRDWRIMGGLALAAVGAANWTIGLSRTEQYSQIIAKASDRTAIEQVYRSFNELDARTDAGVLEPLAAEQRKVSYAAARMDFYHATFLTGRILVIIGLTLGFIGFLRVIRADGRRAMLADRDTRGSTSIGGL
jgi:hypothetical protein